MKLPPRKLIAFCGPKTCGKDTAARFLTSRNSLLGKDLFIETKFAAGVKAVCATLFGYTTQQMEDSTLKERPTEEWPFLAPRWPMMDIANWLCDKYGPDVHVHRWAREFNAIDPRTCVLITDLRFPDRELPAIRERGGMVYYIHRPKAEEALADAKAAGDEMALNPSEAYYADLLDQADRVLNNDSTEDAFREVVLKAVKEDYGDFNSWDAPESMIHRIRTGKFESSNLGFGDSFNG